MIIQKKYYAIILLNVSVLCFGMEKFFARPLGKPEEKKGQQVKKKVINSSYWQVKTYGRIIAVQARESAPVIPSEIHIPAAKL